MFLKALRYFLHFVVSMLLTLINPTTLDDYVACKRVFEDVLKTFMLFSLVCLELCN
jgi:hypothetical protein